MKWVCLGDILHLSVSRVNPPFLFVTKKEKPSATVEGSSAHRSVTLYNDGKQLYSRLPDGKLHHLQFRLMYKPVLCSTITGFFFFEKEIVFKTYGHTLSGDVIVQFWDQSKAHNWNLTVLVKKGKAVGIVDLFNAIGVTGRVG